MMQEDLHLMVASRSIWEMSGKESQREKQQHGGGCMKEEIGKMVSPRMQAVEAAVKHVAHPRERVHVHGALGGERPARIGPTQPRLHMGIVRDVKVVIQVDELVGEGLAIDGNARENKDGTSTCRNSLLRTCFCGGGLPDRRFYDFVV